jgi:hypothetical protein
VAHLSVSYDKQQALGIDLTRALSSSAFSAASSAYFLLPSWRSASEALCKRLQWRLQNEHALAFHPFCPPLFRLQGHGQVSLTIALGLQMWGAGASTGDPH